MPTYDYVCSACRHELEIFHAISVAPKRKCPECGRLTLKRQIGSGGGIIFKGAGFYETDYRSSEYKKAAKADSSEAKPGDSANTSADSMSSGTKPSKKDKPSNPASQ